MLCSRRARFTWLAMYELDRSTDAGRAAFLERVHRRLDRL
jgi:hypothetical protein